MCMMIYIYTSQCMRTYNHEFGVSWQTYTYNGCLVWMHDWMRMQRTNPVYV